MGLSKQGLYKGSKKGLYKGSIIRRIRGVVSALIARISMATLFIALIKPHETLSILEYGVWLFESFYAMMGEGRCMFLEVPKLLTSLSDKHLEFE